MSDGPDMRFDLPTFRNGPHSPLDRFPSPKPPNFEAMCAAQGTPQYQEELVVFQAWLDEHGYQGDAVDRPLKRKA